jgi:hypothetical protein
LSRIAVALLAFAFGSTALPQQADTQQPAPSSTFTSQVSFKFDRPGLSVPHFTLTVSEDGSAHYEAEQIYPATGGGEAPPPQHIERKLSLSSAATIQIFTAARALNRFDMTCASAAKNIADTGTKVLRYSGEGGDGSCVYNYTQDKRVGALTDLFQGIAMTLDMGRKLDFDHRYDRLGLDATISFLAEQVDSGRATELGTIAPTLRSIAEDSDLLERVRLRAAKLLRQVQPAA